MARLFGQAVAALLTWRLGSAEEHKGHSLCTGFEQDWAVCDNLPACAECVPQNCSFDTWGEWSYYSGCTKLCSRTRTIASTNNECGTPCIGAMKETKRCDTPGSRSVDMPESCVLPHRDCSLGPWQEWRDCEEESASSLKQKRRSRLINSYPTGLDVALCSGALTETAPCGVKSKATDCVFSKWGAWKACDRTCGGGYTQRTREVTKEAAHGGTCPHMPLEEMLPCGAHDCFAKQDCIISEWSEWAPLSGSDAQLSRVRNVTKKAEGRGERCNDAIFEIKKTPKHAIVDCVLAAWEDWSGCSKKCGVGQRTRNRAISPWSGTGNCPNSDTEEMEGCNPQLCGDPCGYSDWTAWGSCSQKCGDGTTTRTRSVTTPGFDCNGVLEQAQQCAGKGANCVVLTKDQDCKWSQWEDWTVCTKECGGGSTERNRAVLVPPGEEGAKCAANDMQEAKSCNTQDCHPCINGTWKAWSSWSKCSAKCNSGLQERKREVLTEANYCGTAAVGTEAEFKVCDSGVLCTPKVDCAFSVWGPWSKCSKTCFGVTERARRIVKHASGGGEPCEDTTKELLPCNPGAGGAIAEECYPEKRENCSLSTWGHWSTCTAACSGTKQRLRRIKQLPNYGTACKDEALAEVTGCNTTECKPSNCKDCSFSAWGEWGECAQCKGQQTRERSVNQLPDYCGTPCEPRSVAETRNCSGTCPGVKYCVWEDWKIAVSCPEPSQENCGKQTFTKSRQMHLVDIVKAGQEVLGKGDSTISCTGFQQAKEQCKDSVDCQQNCTRVDCQLGQWLEWSAASCNAVCERSRGIGVVSKCGGKQCEGTLSETKICIKSGCEEPKDCQLSAWTEWEPCNNDDLSSQTTKQRTIEQYPVFGGRVCEGPSGSHETLAVTRGCWEQKPKDCVWADWSNWTACTKTCGSGTMTRKRDFRDVVEFQGIPCEGVKQEVKNCDSQPCPISLGSSKCTWGAWTDWSTGKYAFMKHRTRSEDRPLDPGLLNGACDGESEQLQKTSQEYAMPDWSAWSDCSKSCDGGQRSRHRDRLISKYIGVPDDFPRDKMPKAAIPAEETQGCNLAVCKDNVDKYAPCSYTAWEAWTPCDSTCGAGQQKRARGLGDDRHVWGPGCDEGLIEMRACTSATVCPAAVDCKWHDWSTYSACTVTCDGGEMVRTRSIAVSPDNGGKVCEPLVKEQTAPCNTNACKIDVCRDAAWETWSSWSDCSISCDPGTGFLGIQKRTREISVYANSCGKPAEGATQQHRTCTAAECPTQNCEFGAWTQWSGCNGPSGVEVCDAFQRRHRVIAKNSFGPGAKACSGETEQTTGCKPCKAIGAVDCEFSKFIVIGGTAAWGGCSAQCGGGRVVSRRHIAVQAKNGGKACEGPLEKTESCNTQTCAGFGIRDCEWGAWVQWGSCDTCGPTGQRTRTREISQLPKNGGKNCDLTDSQQITKCDKPCGKTYCAWNDWQAFGDCTSSCGKGQKSRRRYLFSSIVEMQIPPSKENIAVKFAEIHAHIKALDSTQLRDISAAFALGGVAWLVLLAAVRLLPRGRQQAHHYSRMISTVAACDENAASGEFQPCVPADARQIMVDEQDRRPGGRNMVAFDVEERGLE